MAAFKNACSLNKDGIPCNTLLNEFAYTLSSLKISHSFLANYVALYVMVRKSWEKLYSESAIKVFL